MAKQWKFFLFACVFMVIFHSYCHRANAQADTPIDGQTSDTKSPEKFFTEIELVGLVAFDRGPSQPNRTPYLNSILGYQWSKTRFGFYGTNALLYSNDEFFKYSMFADHTITFNPQWKLKIFLELQQLTLSKLGYGLDLDAYEYHFYFKKNENWLGYGGPKTSYGGYVDNPFFWDLIWRMEVSYNTLVFDSGVNFIFVKSGLGYQWPNIYIGMMAGITSPSFDFNVYGEPLVYLLLKINF